MNEWINEWMNEWITSAAVGVFTARFELWRHEEDATFGDDPGR